MEFLNEAEFLKYFLQIKIPIVINPNIACTKIPKESKKLHLFSS